MANDDSEYKSIVVETYYAIKSGKTSRIHVRPIENQFFPQTMDVECSREMRKKYPTGTKFRISVKKTNREGGKPFLYAHFDAPYDVID